MIDFPTAPSNGQSYTYLGIKYVYVDQGAGIGYWAVNSPGTYGVATGAEVDTGTDDVKYISPKALEDSTYVKEAVTDDLIARLLVLEAIHGI